MTVRIKIIAIPPGMAPDHIRSAWVDIEMPAVPDSDSTGEGWDSDANAGGYIVAGPDAVAALANAHKADAAAFWSNPMIPETLRFGAQYCEVMSN